MKKLFTKQDIQNMIDNDLSFHQIQDEIGFENIGQGYGYKSEEAFLLSSLPGYEDTYICYIPEHCYSELLDGTKQIELDSCYTRKDFNDLTQNNTKAEALFDSVDWQHPSSLWEEWDNDFVDERLIKDDKKVDHLMLFIEEEVPYRLKNLLGYDVSDNVIAQIVAEVQENTDIMFDYDGFDSFIEGLYEKVMELDTNEISALRGELNNLKHELNGAAEFDPDMVPKIERKMRDLEIELNKALKNDFKNNNFIDDEEKMKDFYALSKEEFLQSYSYLTEEEYENTKLLAQQEMFVFDEEILIDEVCESLNGYLWTVDSLVKRLPGSHENMDNINFYVDYNLKTGDLKLTSTYYSTVDDGEFHKEEEINLSNEEKQELINKFDEYCNKEYGKSCLELINEVRRDDGFEPISPDNSIQKTALTDKIKSASNRAVKKLRTVDVKSKATESER